MCSNAEPNFSNLAMSNWAVPQVSYCLVAGVLLSASPPASVLIRLAACCWCWCCSGTRGGGHVSLLNIISELKKACNHPFLFESAEDEYRGSEEDNSVVDRLILTSGKMVLLDKLLRRLRQTGHRVLVFSQVGLQQQVVWANNTRQGWGCFRTPEAEAVLHGRWAQHHTLPGTTACEPLAATPYCLRTRTEQCRLTCCLHTHADGAHQSLGLTGMYRDSSSHTCAVPW